MNYIACIYGGADYGCQPQFMLLHVTWLNCNYVSGGQGRGGSGDGNGVFYRYKIDAFRSVYLY